MLHDLSAASQSGSTAGAFSFGKIFESLPHLALVLSPQFIIKAVSEAYLAATLTKRETITGRYVFDVFPDNPGAPNANAVRNLKASLEQALRTGKPHQMPVQHYDVPDPEHPGEFVERYWSPLNIPVLNEQGEVSCIVHQVTNVTERVKTRGLLLQSQANEQAARADAEQQRAHLYAFFREAPEPISILAGEDLIFELVNPAYENFPGQGVHGPSSPGSLARTEGYAGRRHSAAGLPDGRKLPDSGDAPAFVWQRSGSAGREVLYL
jgi:PAS domain-containing protein